MGIMTKFNRKMHKQFKPVREPFPYLGYEYDMAYIKPNKDADLVEAIKHALGGNSKYNMEKMEMVLKNTSIDLRVNLNEKEVTSFLKQVLGDRLPTKTLPKGYLYLALWGDGIRKVSIVLQEVKKTGIFFDMSYMSPPIGGEFSLDIFTNTLSEEASRDIIDLILKQSKVALDSFKVKTKV